MKDRLISIITILSQQFGFSCNSALKYVGILDKEILLPFTGQIFPTCNAIKWSYGLHTQCKNDREDVSEFCFKCFRKGNKRIGNINDRSCTSLLSYTDKKGRKTIPWANYIHDHKLDIEYCLNYAERDGIVIPKEHLKYIKRGRGRPKNSIKRKLVSDKRVFSGIENLENDLFEEKELILYEIEGSGGAFAINDVGEIYSIYEYGAVKKK
jgi:hypothetical protein